MSRRLVLAGIAAAFTAMLGRMGWVDWPAVPGRTVLAVWLLWCGALALCIMLLPVLAPAIIGVTAWRTLAWACRGCRSSCGTEARTIPPASPKPPHYARMQNPS